MSEDAGLTLRRWGSRLSAKIQHLGRAVGLGLGAKARFFSGLGPCSRLKPSSAGAYCLEMRRSDKISFHSGAQGAYETGSRAPTSLR